MNDLETLCPEVAGEWHPTRNRKLTPGDVTIGSNTKVWWRCKACAFDWQASVHDRVTGGHGCPHCAGHQPMRGTDDLATTHPQLAREWHRKANESFRPSSVTAESHRAAWWRCSTCHYEWRTAIRYRALLGTGCPACAGKVALPGRTFADVVRIRPGEWSSRNELRPSELLPYSHRRVWRRCLRCGEEWQQPVQSWTSIAARRLSVGPPRHDTRLR
jgi:DNA-directed RNA polymerase subunit RPC12/RpoP